MKANNFETYRIARTLIYELLTVFTLHQLTKVDDAIPFKSVLLVKDIKYTQTHTCTT